MKFCFLNVDFLWLQWILSYALISFMLSFFLYKANICIHNVFMFITTTVSIYTKFGLHTAFWAKQRHKLGASVCCSGVTRLRLWSTIRSITSPFCASQRYFCFWQQVKSYISSSPWIVLIPMAVYPNQFIHEPSSWHSSLDYEGKINLRIGTRPWAGRLQCQEFNSQQEQEIILFSITFRVALGSTQPPTQ